MWRDTIVKEVRELRRRYAKQFNYDIEHICQDIKQQEIKSGRNTVSLPAKRTNSTARRGNAKVSAKPGLTNR